MFKIIIFVIFCRRTPRLNKKRNCEYKCVTLRKEDFYCNYDLFFKINSKILKVIETQVMKYYYFYRAIENNAKVLYIVKIQLSLQYLECNLIFTKLS